MSKLDETREVARRELPRVIARRELLQTTLQEAITNYRGIHPEVATPVLYAATVEGLIKTSEELDECLRVIACLYKTILEESD